MHLQHGAKFGYALLWTLIPTTLALVVVQEMAARMGAITGKGLSDLIREEFELRATFFTMLVLALADLGNIAAEFAGIFAGLGTHTTLIYRGPQILRGFDQDLRDDVTAAMIKRGVTIVNDTTISKIRVRYSASYPSPDCDGVSASC